MPEVSRFYGIVNQWDNAKSLKPLHKIDPLP